MESSETTNFSRFSFPISDMQKPFHRGNCLWGVKEALVVGGRVVMGGGGWVGVALL